MGQVESTSSQAATTTGGGKVTGEGNFEPTLTELEASNVALHFGEMLKGGGGGGGDFVSLESFRSFLSLFPVSMASSIYKQAQGTDEKVRLADLKKIVSFYSPRTHASREKDILSKYLALFNSQDAEEKLFTALAGSALLFRIQSGMEQAPEGDDPSSSSSSSGLTSADSKCLSRWAAEFTKLTSACPLLRVLSDFLPRLCLPFQYALYTELCFGDDKPMLPSSFNVFDKSSKTFLSIAHLWALNCSLPPCVSRKSTDGPTPWRQLYSSQQHGSALNRLTYQVFGHEKDKIVFIKTTKGELFGAYTTGSWKSSTDFMGDNTFFLFSLEPELRFMFSSGTGTNYMYLHTHSSQSYQKKKKKEGLGFGGRDEFFRIFVDGELNEGSVLQSCSTYKHGTFLAEGASTFKVAAIEVWGIGDQKDAAQQKAAREKENKMRQNMRKVNRKRLAENWEDSPDRKLLEWGGVYQRPVEAEKRTEQ